MVIVIQIMTPLFVYFVAEEIGVSGILAVVMAGIAHGIEKEHLQNTTTKLRIISDNTWYVLEYVLNGFVFTLLGFCYQVYIQDLVVKMKIWHWN